VDEFGAVCWPTAPTSRPTLCTASLPSGRRPNADHSGKRLTAPPARTRARADRKPRAPTPCWVYRLFLRLSSRRRAEKRSAFRLQLSPVGDSSSGCCGLCPQRGYRKGQSRANGNRRDEGKQSGGMRCAFPLYACCACCLSRSESMKPRSTTPTLRKAGRPRPIEGAGTTCGEASRRTSSKSACSPVALSTMSSGCPKVVGVGPEEKVIVSVRNEPGAGLSEESDASTVPPASSAIVYGLKVSSARLPTLTSKV